MHIITNNGLKELRKSFEILISQLPEPKNIKTQNAIRLISKNLKEMRNKSL